MNGPCGSEFLSNQVGEKQWGILCGDNKIFRVDTIAIIDGTSKFPVAARVFHVTGSDPLDSSAGKGLLGNSMASVTFSPGPARSRAAAYNLHPFAGG